MSVCKAVLRAPSLLFAWGALACATAVESSDDASMSSAAGGALGSIGGMTPAGGTLVGDGGGLLTGGVMNTGGMGETGGASVGGMSGGATSGGSSSGGAASGGSASGGAASGGSASGGAASGGSASGGAASGGTSSGGESGSGGDTSVECTEPDFSEAATYGEGDRVVVEGEVYECKPYPYTGWCSIPGYEPGTGLHWEQAWDDIGPCEGEVGTGGAGSGGTSGTGGSPSSECPLDEVMDEATFLDWYSERRNSFYTYSALCTALETFPDFATTGTLDDRKREVAAFFANVSRETGELEYIEQIVKDPPVYYGRGPLQLTHSYNYEAAGTYLGVDLTGENANLLATDPVLTWEASLWFWMESGPEGVTCHQAITEGDGFGATIDIINGAFECGASNGPALERIAYYESYAEILGVDPGGDLTCW